MTARTHKEFAIGFACIATMILYKYRVLEINYYLMFIIMTALNTKGALFPDVDHFWKNVKEKTVINWCLNKLIHMTGGKHRSWQTHSLDICLFSWVGIILLLKGFYQSESIDNVNYQIALLIVNAFYTGWISHLISDMLTVGGVYILILKKKNVRLVPKKLFNIEFKTGDAWERWVYKTTLKINAFLTIGTLIYPIIFDEKTSTWIINLIER